MVVMVLSKFCTFTADTRWVVYEGVMADIFDHLLAAAPFFNLEVFELPSSSDLKALLHADEPRNGHEAAAASSAGSAM